MKDSWSNTRGTGQLFARSAAECGYRPVVIAESPDRYQYETIPPPVVLKPVPGSGSVGVRLCRTNQEAPAHAEALSRPRAGAG